MELDGERAIDIWLEVELREVKVDHGGGVGGFQEIGMLLKVICKYHGIKF